MIAIDILYRVRRQLLAWIGRPTRGVRVMAFDAAGRVLLVRHRYGRRDLLMLPGGGIDRGETPLAAAVRELAEETGCRLDDPIAAGVFAAMADGRRDTVHLFRGTTRDQPCADGVEIDEALFVALDAVPADVSPATRRRIEELAGRREGDGRW